MSFKNEHYREIVRARLLFTALMETVLFAWNHGCTAANPNEDVRYLAGNHRSVVRMIAAYFNQGLPPPEDRNETRSDFSVSYAGRQIGPVLETIRYLHDAVTGSSLDCARRIVGSTPHETIQNLIVFFEEAIPHRPRER